MRQTPPFRLFPPLLSDSSLCLKTLSNEKTYSESSHASTGRQAQAISLARSFNGNSFVLLYAFHLLFTVEGTKLLLHPSLWHFSIAVAFIWHPSCRPGGTCLSPPPSPLHHFPHYWFPLVVYALEVEVRRRRTRETSKGFLLKTLNWNLGSTPFSGMECYLQA